MDTVVLEGECSLFTLLDGDCNLSSMLEGEAGAFIEVHTDVQYTGDYTITPTAQAQILQTKDMVCFDNITIEPIPDNYGLITWNGSALTVS